MQMWKLKSLHNRIDPCEERSTPDSRPYALITGASQGLGRAFAEACARGDTAPMRMNLALVALPDSGLARVARDIAEQHEVQVEYIEMDLTAPGSPEALHGWIQDRQLPISVLINNAGVGYNSRFEDSTLHENESCILLNNLALVKITRLLLPELKRHPQAFILNVASMAAFFPIPFMPVYAPSKAFIVHFSLALREEMRDTSVSVSVVCPNGIRTNDACRSRIAAHGLIGKLVSMDPDQVADEALRGLWAGKATIVPGLANRVVLAVGRHAPNSLLCTVTSALYGKTAKQEYSAQRRPVLETVTEGE
jgi:short-subunit dehydrogenase